MGSSGNFSQPSLPQWNLPSITALPHHLLSTFYATTGPSVNFPCDHESTFCADCGLSVSFHHLLMRLQGLPSTFITFPFCQWTFHQLPLTFHAAARSSVNICAVASLCIIFSQPSLPQRELLLILHSAVGPFVNFPCSRGRICQPSMLSQDIPSTFIAFPYCW